VGEAGIAFRLRIGDPLLFDRFLQHFRLLFVPFSTLLQILSYALYRDKRHIIYMPHIEMEELTIGPWKADRYRVNTGEAIAVREVNEVSEL